MSRLSRGPPDAAGVGSLLCLEVLLGAGVVGLEVVM